MVLLEHITKDSSGAQIDTKSLERLVYRENKKAGQIQQGFADQTWTQKITSAKASSLRKAIELDLQKFTAD